MTAVEWLIEQLLAPCRTIPSHIIEKAKEMEKEQISNAFLKGYYYCNSRDLEEQDDDFEFYFYNETYGGNK